MGRVITIASGKGGVGKTTMAVGLGEALAAQGKKVLLVDLDMGLRNIDVLLGMETRVLNHLGDYFAGSLSWQEALTEDENRPGLYLLAASQNMDLSLVTEESMIKLCRELREAFDLVLLDCPAGVGHYFQIACACADEGIVVTNPSITAVRDADKVLYLMGGAGVKDRFVLVNRLRYKLTKSRVLMTPEDISDVLGTELVGVVPEDEGVLIAGNEGRSLLSTRTPSAAAFKRIARRMLGMAEDLPPYRLRRGGLFHK